MNKSKIPITRLTKFFSEDDFLINTIIGMEYLHGDINMKLVLFRVDRQDTDTDEVYAEAGKDKIKYNDVFSEKVSAFTDKEFWGDYNVIEPDQSIESAIRRLSRKLKFSDREGNK